MDTPARPYRSVGPEVKINNNRFFLEKSFNPKSPRSQLVQAIELIGTDQRFRGNYR